MKNMMRKPVVFILALSALTLAGCTGTKGSSSSATNVDGTYSCVVAGAFGDETLQFVLSEGTKARFSLPGNDMLTDQYDGTYSNAGLTVTVLGLTNIDATSSYVHPGLWPTYIDATGNCSFTVDISAKTFAFIALPATSSSSASSSQGGSSSNPLNGPTHETGTSTGDAVTGTYTFGFSGDYGDETFTLLLNEDLTCTLSLNDMMGPWSGTYWHEDKIVHLLALTKADATMGAHPDLWTNWLDSDGYATVKVLADSKFEFVEITSGGNSSSSSSSSSAGGEDGYDNWSSVSYGSDAANTFTGKMKQGPGSRATIITIPGGAFKFCDASAHSSIRNYFADKNYVAITLNYRVGTAGSYPNCIEDVKNGIQYIVDHADEYHVDASNISVLGCSAGGYLAAMASLTGNDDFKSTGASSYTYKVNNLIDFFGATEWMESDYLASDDSPESSMMGKAISSLTAEEKSACDPSSYLATSNVKKIWVSHGDADTTVDPGQSQAFYNAAKTAKGENVVHYEAIAGATHESPLFYADDNLAKVETFMGTLPEEMGGDLYSYTESQEITTPGGAMTISKTYKLTLQAEGVAIFRNAESTSCYTGSYAKDGTSVSVTGLVDNNGMSIVGGKDSGAASSSSETSQVSDAVSFIGDGAFNATLGEGSFTPAA